MRYLIGSENHRTQVWVPHFKKVAVADLLPGDDPSDPPLTVKSQNAAVEFVFGLMFNPQILFCSPKRRCMDMLTAAQNLLSASGYMAEILETLAQPDNLDVNGHVYGQLSTSEDWLRWGEQSVRYIDGVMARYGFTVALVLSHRPVTAGAVAFARGLGVEGIDPTDAELVPMISIAHDGSQFYLPGDLPDM